MAAIIFDLDGTIADSFHYVADFLAREAGAEKLSDDERRQLRGLSMSAMARYFGFSWWRLPGLFVKGRRAMRRVIRRVEPFPGIAEVIRKLHAEGHELFIVSSNSVRNVSAFLHAHDLHVFFLQIYGGIDIFGKAPALRRLLRDQHLERKDSVYIGDELRDVEAAQSVGLRVIAVTWGFARPSDLAEHKPTALADTPYDLVRILEEI